MEKMSIGDKITKAWDEKSSFGFGFFIAILALILSGVIFFFIVPFTMIILLLWGIIEITREHKKFGLGLIVGGLLPLLVFGGCFALFAVGSVY